jgi:hypothetical protein
VIAHFTAEGEKKGDDDVGVLTGRSMQVKGGHKDASFMIARKNPAAPRSPPPLGVSVSIGGTVGSTAGIAEEPPHLKRKPTSSSKMQSTEIVLPPHANHMGNTFGGEIMNWAEEVARICAHRHGRVRMVLASIDDIYFRAPSSVGDRIVLSGQVNELPLRVQLYVYVVVWCCMVNVVNVVCMVSWDQV